VSDFCERFAAEDDKKFDIADYVVGRFLEMNRKGSIG
jgi:hypothetical protein